MNQRVTIVIEKGKHHKFVKGGREFTRVSFQASSYGLISPCDTDEQVTKAVASCQKWILSEGDIPVIKNTLEVRKLDQWF